MLGSRALASANDWALAAVFFGSRIAAGLPLLLSLWGELAAARGAGRLGRAHFTALTAILVALAAANAVWFRRLAARLIFAPAARAAHAALASPHAAHSTPHAHAPAAGGGGRGGGPAAAAAGGVVRLPRAGSGAGKLGASADS